MTQETLESWIQGVQEIEQQLKAAITTEEKDKCLHTASKYIATTWDTIIASKPSIVTESAWRYMEQEVQMSKGRITTLENMIRYMQIEINELKGRGTVV